MPDITMCSNKTCPLRMKCYRFLAKPSPRQSYSHFQPRFPRGATTDQCEYLMPLMPNDAISVPKSTDR